MTKLTTETQINEFLSKPRLAIIMYRGARTSPTGVPVWFHWDGTQGNMFAGRNSAKVKHLKQNPAISVLVTNTVGEPENWVAFDGEAGLSDFTAERWHTLIDLVAPRYWDMSEPAYQTEIEQWRANPEAFVSITLLPDNIRTGS